jgi:hypothetical protein
MAGRQAGYSGAMAGRDPQLVSAPAPTGPRLRRAGGDRGYRVRRPFRPFNPCWRGTPGPRCSGRRLRRRHRHTRPAERVEPPCRRNPAAGSQRRSGTALDGSAAGTGQPRSGRHRRGLNKLGRADEDVVNFIGLLFDYILNDRNLAIPMKALIARLQIPIVKLAIIDKTFFERSSHPARQLLNELSSAGIGWSSAAELKRDAVYDKIESVVIRVLNGFSDNPADLRELSTSCGPSAPTTRSATSRMEQRVKEKESGRARTPGRQAGGAAGHQPEGLRPAPAPGAGRLSVGRLEPRAGDRSACARAPLQPAGNRLISTLDDLLWSVQPLDDLQHIERRDELRDDLLDRLDDGMNLIQLSDAEQVSGADTIAKPARRGQQQRSRLSGRRRGADARRALRGNGGDRSGSAAGDHGRLPGSAAGARVRRQDQSPGRRHLGGDLPGRRRHAALQAGHHRQARRPLRVRQSPRHEGGGEDAAWNWPATCRTIAC